MFTCDDGDCIPLEQRCDHLFDCQDQSDEHDCNFVTFNQGSYLKNYPPMSRQSKTKIQVKVIISDISAIDELQMGFQAKLVVFMTWRDSRLTYFNLIDNDENLVSLNMMKELWIPKLVFVNSNMHLTDYLMKVKKVQLTGTPLPHSYLYEGKQYEGKDNDIILVGSLDGEFSCTYNLQNYPFDTQVCSIIMKLPEHLQDNLQITESSIEYKGEEQLVQFRIQDVDIEHNEKSLIKIKVILKRIPLYHIFVTYIPTTCILIMALKKHSSVPNVMKLLQHNPY